MTLPGRLPSLTMLQVHTDSSFKCTVTVFKRKSQSSAHCQASLAARQEHRQVRLSD